MVAVSLTEKKPEADDTYYNGTHIFLFIEAPVHEEDIHMGRGL